MWHLPSPQDTLGSIPSITHTQRVGVSIHLFITNCIPASLASNVQQYLCADTDQGRYPGRRHSLCYRSLGVVAVTRKWAALTPSSCHVTLASSVLLQG